MAVANEKATHVPPSGTIISMEVLVMGMLAIVVGFVHFTKLFSIDPPSQSTLALVKAHAFQEVPVYHQPPPFVYFLLKLRYIYTLAYRSLTSNHGPPSRFFPRETGPRPRPRPRPPAPCPPVSSFSQLGDWDSLLSHCRTHFGTDLHIHQNTTARLPRATIESLYVDHRDAPFFPTLVDSLADHPVRLAELTGPGAIRAWRRCLGPTDPAVARTHRPTTLRALYGASVTNNALHGSASADDAARELDLVFFSSSSAPRKEENEKKKGPSHPSAALAAEMERVRMANQEAEAAALRAAEMRELSELGEGELGEDLNHRRASPGTLIEEDIMVDMRGSDKEYEGLKMVEESVLIEGGTEGYDLHDGDNNEEEEEERGEDDDYETVEIYEYINEFGERVREEVVVTTDE